MSSKRAFTLVELLVVIAIIAVLLAVLLPAMANVKNIARRLQCSNRLKEIGNAYSLYQNSTGGALPTPEQTCANTATASPRWIQHYFMYRRETTSGSGIYTWYNMGCMFAGGFIDDGKTFYCPATEGWLDDYKRYCDPAPWGTLPQKYNYPPTGNGNQWVRAIKGYSYWPQSKSLVKSNVATEVHANAVGVYQIGYPVTPMHITQLLQNKSFAADYTFHMVRGSGWNLNAVFPDGHVAFQSQPRNPAGKQMYFDSGQFPDTVVHKDAAGDEAWDDAAEKSRSAKVTTAEFFYALQP
jgi:prepilin-type N-terminal cleavage/methylation domain-containing protein